VRSALEIARGFLHARALTQAARTRLKENEEIGVIGALRYGNARGRIFDGETAKAGFRSDSSYCAKLSVRV